MDQDVFTALELLQELLDEHPVTFPLHQRTQIEDGNFTIIIRPSSVGASITLGLQAPQQHLMPQLMVEGLTNRSFGLLLRADDGFGPSRFFIRETSEGISIPQIPTSDGTRRLVIVDAQRRPLFGDVTFRPAPS